jgi:predicted transposase YdaD
MSNLKGQSINEKLHNREIELREEGREEGIKEGIKEGRIKVINTIKTLEKEGKTPEEIMSKLKQLF